MGGISGASFESSRLAARRHFTDARQKLPHKPHRTEGKYCFFVFFFFYNFPILIQEKISQHSIDIS